MAARFLSPRLHSLSFKDSFDLEVYGPGRLNRKGSVLGDLPRSNSLLEMSPLDAAIGVWDPQLQLWGSC